MRTTLALVFVAALFAGGTWVSAQSRSTSAGSSARSEYSPPRTPWGDPDLQGIYTNADENGTPMEQPADLAGKRLEDFGDKEMAALRAERQKRAQASAREHRWKRGGGHGCGAVALVRTPCREQRAAVARVRSRRAGRSRRLLRRRGSERPRGRPHAKAAGRLIRGRTAACTTVASPSVCRAR